MPKNERQQKRCEWVHFDRRGNSTWSSSMLLVTKILAGSAASASIVNLSAIHAIRQLCQIIQLQNQTMPQLVVTYSVAQATHTADVLDDFLYSPPLQIHDNSHVIREKYFCNNHFASFLERLRTCNIHLFQHDEQLLSREEGAHNFHNSASSAAL